MGLFSDKSPEFFDQLAGRTTIPLTKKAALEGAAQSEAERVQA